MVLARKFLRQLAPLAWALSLWLWGAAPLAVRAQVETPSPAAVEEAVVTLRDKPVFTLYRGDAALRAIDRARAASRALAEASSAPSAEPVRWETRGTRAVVFVGNTQVVALSLEDVAAAQEGSLEMLASRVTTQVRGAVARERQRTSLANSVFAVSLVVFFGLITLYLMGKLRAFAGAAHDFLINHPQSVPALKLNKLEVLGPASVRNALIVSMGVGRVLGLLGLVYAWLVVSLSLFERTRPLVQRLTGVLLEPLSALVSRVALALPMFVVAIVASALVAVLVRVTELFFVSVERAETRISWIPPDLAHATSVLVRGALVILALLFAGPILTGDQDGPLSRGSMVLLAGLALAATPLACAALAGVAMVFSRAVRVGDRVNYGGEQGQVRAIGLLWLVLEDESGASVRVPHLRALWYPTRVHKRERP